MSLVSGLLHQTIDYIKSTTVDGYGDVTPTTVYRDVPCRWVTKLTILTDATAKVVKSTVQVWILPSYSISDTYEVVKDSETYKIVGIEERYNLSGTHDHTKLYLV